MFELLAHLGSETRFISTITGLLGTRLKMNCSLPTFWPIWKRLSLGLRLMVDLDPKEPIRPSSRDGGGDFNHDTTALKPHHDSRLSRGGKVIVFAAVYPFLSLP